MQSEGSILDLDAIAIAAAVGRLAAARLHALMTEGPDATVDLLWFDFDNRHRIRDAKTGEIFCDEEAAERRVVKLADYIWSRSVADAEQVHLKDHGGHWHTRPLAYRLAMEVFRSTVSNIARVLLEEQGAELRRRKAADAPAQTLKLEDSIFEPHGSLGEILPHVREGLAHPGAANPAQREDQGEPAAPAPESALSVGEAPAGVQRTRQAKRGKRT